MQKANLWSLEGKVRWEINQKIGCDIYTQIHTK